MLDMYLSEVGYIWLILAAVIYNRKDSNTVSLVVL